MAEYESGARFYEDFQVIEEGDGVKNPQFEQLSSELNRALESSMTQTTGKVILGVLGLVILVELYTNWRLIRRMGYPGPWSLFLWVPYVSVLFWAGIAFWRWPNQRK